MRWTHVTTLLVAAFVLSGFRAEAQERKGFWFDFGVGAGSVGLSADGASSEDDRIGSGVASLSLGWALSPRLLAGFDLRVSVLDVQGDIEGEMALGNFMATLAYYPRDTSGFFVKGGIGGALVDLSFEQQNTTLTTNLAKGLGLSGRVGYDFYLGRGFSVTPSGGVSYGRTGDLVFLGETLFSNWRYTVLDATVSISFH